MTVAEFKTAHPEIIVKCDEHLEEVFKFAESIGKKDRLLRALEQAAFPTFFGRPAHTVLTKDFAPHSFYFMVYLDLARALGNESGWVMNGGVIFHPRWNGDERDDTQGDWSVHT